MAATVKITTAAMTPGSQEVNDTAFMNRIRDGLINGAYDPMSFGGSMDDPVEGTGLQPLAYGKEVKLATDQEVVTNGYVFTACGRIKCSSASVSVTPKVYDYTTIASPTLVTAGSPTSSTTEARFSFQIAAHPAGNRYYRLILDKTADLPVWAEAKLERSVP